jgi:hypothetical protein
MPIPALLSTLLPYIGSAAAGFAGSKLAGMGDSSSPQQSGGGGSLRPQQGNFLTGYQSQMHQLPRYSPQQQNIMSQIGQQGFQNLQGNKFDFGPIEQMARQDFTRKTIPSIAERYSNSGGSSAYGDQMAQAGVDLETNLAGMRQGYNLQQQGFNKDLLGLGLQPTFDTKIEAAAPGLAQTLPGNLAQSLPSLLMLLSHLGYFGKAEGAK